MVARSSRLSRQDSELQLPGGAICLCGHPPAQQGSAVVNASDFDLFGHESMGMANGRPTWAYDS